MANTKISQLPVFTGNTTGSFLVLNDAGNTTTFKVSRETLFTGSLEGTASFAVSASQASNAQTASYVLNAVSASYVLNAISASNAQTASLAVNAINSVNAQTASLAAFALTALTASFLTPTASYVDPLNQDIFVSGSVNVSGSVRVTGSLITTTDATINGNRAGFGPSSNQQNTVFGSSTFGGFLPSYSGCTLFGNGVTPGLTSGINNSLFGFQAGNVINTGNNNTGVGFQAMDSWNGDNNTIIGGGTVQNITSGNHNTIIGANITSPSTTLNNTIILADGQGNQRLYINNSGNVGIGRTNPTYRLDVSGSGNFTDGLDVTGNVTINNGTSSIRPYSFTGIKGYGVGIIGEIGFGSVETTTILSIQNTPVYSYGTRNGYALGIVFTDNAATGSFPGEGDVKGILYKVRSGNSYTSANPITFLNGDVTLASSPTFVGNQTVYGFKWNLSSSHNPTTHWAIYAENGNNYFGGNVAIGTTNTSASLTVSGSAIITGSLNITQGITGSLFGTASWAVNAVSTSVVVTFVTSSNIVSDYTGSLTISGSLTVTGSLNAASITGSLLGTASLATTASYALNSTQPISGKVIYVDATSPNATNTRGSLSKYDLTYPFSTVQAAVNAAATGDSIWVYPGTYNESIFIGFSGSISINMTLYSGVTINGGSSYAISVGTNAAQCVLNLDMMPNSIVRNTGNASDPSGSAVLLKDGNCGINLTGLGNPLAKSVGASVDPYTTGNPSIISTNAYCLFGFGQGGDFNGEKMSGVTLYSQNSIPIVNGNGAIYENCVIYSPNNYGIYESTDSFIRCLIISGKSCSYAFFSHGCHFVNCDLYSTNEYGIFTNNNIRGRAIVNGCRINSFSQSLQMNSNNTAPTLYEICNNVMGSRNLASNNIATIFDSNINSTGIFSNNVVNKSVTLPSTIEEFNTYLSNNVSGSIPFIIT